MREYLRKGPLLIAGGVVTGVIFLGLAGYQLGQRGVKAPTMSSASRQGTSEAPEAKFTPDPEGRPSALIVTKSLADLPKDILKQPLLKALLSEDFLYYYESDEGFLALKGTLRRLAFEHDATLFDELVSLALSAPAEIAFWKNYNGKLDHSMLVLQRKGVADLVALVAKVSLADAQLSVHEKRTVEGAGDVTIYKLNHVWNSSLYFAGVKDQLLLFTHPEMPIPTESLRKRWSKLAQEQFGSSKDEGSYSRLFEPKVERAKHRLYFTTKFLSFGYQAFFPAIESLRFAYDAEGWSTSALLKQADSDWIEDAPKLWSVVPKAPSFCMALPVDPSRVKAVGERLPKEQAEVVAALADASRGPVGVCWYANSNLFSPLFVTRVQSRPGEKQLQALFERSIGGIEKGILTDEEKERLAEQKARKAAGEVVDDPVRATHFISPFEVTVKSVKDGVMITREVSSRYGLHNGEKSKRAQDMRSKRFFRVKLAAYQDYLLFSPDDRLVDDALSVIDKKFPSLSDTMKSSKGSPSLVFSPSRTGELLKQTVLESLPTDQESVFRESVSRRLFPQLEKLKDFPMYSLSVPGGLSKKSAKWEPLEWQAF